MEVFLLDNVVTGQAETELAKLLNQLLQHIKKKQLHLSEIVTDFMDEKNSTKTVHEEITSLLRKMIEVVNKTNISESEVPQLLTQLKDSTKLDISDKEIHTFWMRLIKNKKKSKLTSAEISALWLQYMGDSMAICVYNYFLEIVENEKIKDILQFALQLAEDHIAKISEFLRSAHFQIPVGFTENDVYLDAPRLFTDKFLLFYSYIMTIHGLTAYSLAITNSERKDIQDYFFECIVTSKELFQRIVDLARTLPNYSSVPTIPSPLGTDYMQSMGIFSNLLGDKRPLNSSEISNLFFNSKKTGLIKSLSLAFSQVAKEEEVRKFMMKNVKLAGKDAESFNTILQQDHLPIPETWDAEITDSTISPFSDKLMMFHVAFLINAALSYYGAALGSSLRSDIIMNYNKVYFHTMEAGALCFNILVKHGWLEKQPEAIDRKALAQSSSK